MAFPSTDLDVIVEAYLGADPTDDPSAWPAPVDLSSRLLRKPIQIRRGRGNNQKTAQAGACTLWLDNTDGALTPLLATSTYYPDWDLGVPLRVSVDGVGVAPPYVRHAGFVASIEAVMVPGVGGSNISAVRVTSAGVLRRLSQGSVFSSPLRRVYQSQAQPTLAGYWPCEDTEGSTVVASGLPGGPPLVGVIGTGAAVSTIAPHFTTGIAGSSGSIDFVDWEPLTTFAASITLPSASGFQVEFSARSDAGVDLGVVRLVNGGSGGGIILSLVAAYADDVAHHKAIRFVQNGADIDVTSYTDGVVTSTTTLPGATIVTSLYLEMYPFILSSSLPVTTGTFMMSHLAVYGFAAMDAPTTRAPAVDGYAGEQAHIRIERVCGEEGIPFSGIAMASNACGPQPTGESIIGLLTDAETVDHGMLIEDMAFGLDYRAMSQRVNLAPAMTIDLSTYRTTAGTQADVLSPVRDDARIRNEWTISRPDGSEATAVDAAHIAKRGRYRDSATVNVAADEQLPDEAAWRVHEGTFDGLRYQSIPLDIGANL